MRSDIINTDKKIINTDKKKKYNTKYLIIL